MHSIVTLVGGFSLSELDKVMPQARVLDQLPPLEADQEFADREPQTAFREIKVSHKPGKNICYQIIDMGEATGTPGVIPLARRMYSGEEVAALRQLVGYATV